MSLDPTAVEAAVTAHWPVKWRSDLTLNWLTYDGPVTVADLLAAYLLLLGKAYTYGPDYHVQVADLAWKLGEKTVKSRRLGRLMQLLRTNGLARFKKGKGWRAVYPEEWT